MPTLVCSSKGKLLTPISIPPRSRSPSTSSRILSLSRTTATATGKLKIFAFTALFFLFCERNLFSNCFAEGITHGPSTPIIYETRCVNSKRIGMSADNVKNSASALGELKETIRSQKKEIERLKAQIDGSVEAKKSLGHDHGHGGGEELTEEEVIRYVNDPFFRVGLQRVGWLGIFLGSLSATALIMNVFEETLEKHIELALFVPLLAGHGGNTGGQTVGTILSALSAGTVTRKDAPKIVWKESMAGILSGSILGAIVAPIAYKGLGVSFHVAVVLFFTLPLVSMIASTLGSIIPFVCVFVGLDPSVIAAPAMTSLVDVAGLMGYFMIANYIFQVYGLEL
mmetsp:Transcript_12017/g.28501  ORF Transcript_12017/g.28501 Transcript_12017/m.28501 type:complete len:340 (+) Transcript_12017:197-1216(+)